MPTEGFTPVEGEQIDHAPLTIGVSCLMSYEHTGKAARTNQHSIQQHSVCSLTPSVQKRQQSRCCLLCVGAFAAMYLHSAMLTVEARAGKGTNVPSRVGSAQKVTVLQ